MEGRNPRILLLEEVKEFEKHYFDYIHEKSLKIILV